MSFYPVSGFGTAFRFIAPLTEKPSFKLDFSYDDSRARRQIAYLKHQIDDYSEPLQEASEYIIEQAKESFRFEGANIGAPWAPPARNYGWWPMLRKKDMYRGFRWKVTGLKKSQKAVVDNPVKHFKYHQSSKQRIQAKSGGVRLPRRPMLAMTDQNKKEISKMFLKYLHKHAAVSSEMI